MSGFELLDASRSVVVVIDLQGKLMDMIHRPRLVIDATKRLMLLAQACQVPVLLTEQYPQGLGPTHPELREVFNALATPKRCIEKNSFSICGEPRFDEALNELLPDVPGTKRQLVLAGIEAHVCITQSVFDLLARGEQVFACWECISGRGEEYYKHALKRMRQAGAQITNHESVCFEWARNSKHPAFKEMNRILRDGQLT